jgi:hypothetical protein
MLKKTALSLFGLVAMMIGFSTTQAHAGVVVEFGPTYGRPVYVRPYRYVAPVPYVAYRPDPYFYGPSFYAPSYVRPSWRYRRDFYENRYYAPRFEHREFVERHPYWRR